jgi:hypothetical protein
MKAFDILATQRRDDFIRRMGATADGLHSCFYHGDTPADIVEVSLRDVKRLISKLNSRRKG